MATLKATPASISPISAIPLAAGEVLAGMTLVLTTQLFWSFGFQYNVFNDKKRQVFLNFLMMLASVNGLFAYPFNATLESISGSNITTLASFAFVQFGLVIINHNSLVRFNAFSLFMSKNVMNRICLVLYFLPFSVFIPIYFAAAERMPKNQLINMDDWNRHVFKPMTVGLVFTTELLATISDILLLRSVLRIRNQLLAATGITIKKQNKIQSVSSDLIANYLLTWFFLFFDILVKLSIMAGYPFLFDSIVSILNIALRARTNILYGLNMKNLFEGPGSEDAGSTRVTSAASVARRYHSDYEFEEMQHDNPTSIRVEDQMYQKDSEIDLGYYYESRSTSKNTV